MKSKVTITSFRNIICIFALLCLNLSESAPTFGDEFVHIKVHLPKDDEAHGPPVHSAHPHPRPHPHPHPTAHAPVPPQHKVVHHYHHRKRKPAKKSQNPFAKHAGLLESILISEIKKPIKSDHYKYINHAEDIAQHIDSFAPKPVKPQPHVETYAVIEETVPKPTVETYKVIETKVPQQQLHHHHHHDSHDEGYNYKPKGHTETYKVIDSLFDDYHAHFKDPDASYSPPKKQRVKTVQITESHEPDYEQDHSHYGHHSPSHDLEHDFVTHDDHASSGGYHYDSKSHANSVKIVETKAPHQHSQEYSINFGKRPHSETVEIVQSNTPSRSNKYYNKHQHHQHSYDDHGYYYEAPSSGVASSHEDAYSSGYEYKPQRYHDSYRTSSDEHYAHEPAETYLPPKRSKGNFHSHHHSNVRHNSLYHDEPELAFDSTLTSPNDSYLPPLLPQTLPGLQQSSEPSSAHWQTYDDIYKATETYTGIDSYSAPHVQGLGSNGYQYPSSYP